ncbi:MAG: hypothetical protein HY897_02065 [Deltaproteobacteria bacterium]|nr:hypothetical protein [Deltaproteobacteria bacterium]
MYNARVPTLFQRLRDTALGRLLHFELLDDGLPPDPGFRQGWAGILPGLGDDRLFLDTYEEAMIREPLEAYGIMDGLRARGFKKIRIELNTSDPSFQQLLVYSDDPPCSDPLAEIALHRGSFATRAPFAEKLHGLVLPMLFISWLRLQNPLKNGFQPERPRLPGQKHPGLGLGNEVMVMLSALGQKLLTEGLANTPEYPHNAVLYSQRFMYLDPEAEGRLQALKRDLRKHGLADASWGIMLGCVTEADSGRVLEWFKEEQILPLGHVLRAYFHSRAYRTAARTAAASVKYVLDTKKLAGLPMELPADPPRSSSGFQTAGSGRDPEGTAGR